MINFSKKRIGALVVGTVMTFGTAFPALTSAAAFDGPHDGPAFHQGMGHANKGVLAEIEKELNISETDFTNYKAKGYSQKDVIHAALIAKASGKSLDSVISLKTADTTWHYVMGKVNVTKDQLKQVQQDLFIDSIVQRTGADKTAVTNLSKQGYQGRDIMMAAELAKLSSKPINDVIAMKKINNTWQDVASSLGVDKASLHQALGSMHGDNNDNSADSDK